MVKEFLKYVYFLEWTFLVSKLQNPLLISMILAELPHGVLHLKASF